MILMGPFQLHTFYDQTSSFTPRSPLMLASSLPRWAEILPADFLLACALFDLFPPYSFTGKRTLDECCVWFMCEFCGVKAGYSVWTFVPLKAWKAVPITVAVTAGLCSIYWKTFTLFLTNLGPTPLLNLNALAAGCDGCESGYQGVRGVKKGWCWAVKVNGRRWC